MRTLEQLQTLEILLRLPGDAAVTTEEAAVILNTSVRSLERMRAPSSPTKGPRYQQRGGPGSIGANQKITYLVKDLKGWQESITVSDNIEAAIRKGQLVAFSDLTEDRAFWRSPEGKIAGFVMETDADIFVERLGHWSIEWILPIDAASGEWNSTEGLSEFLGRVQDILESCLTSIRVQRERLVLGRICQQAENITDRKGASL